MEVARDFEVAGGRGFESLYRGPEPRVLPLDDPPEGKRSLASFAQDRQRGADLRCERSHSRKRAASTTRTATSNPPQTLWIDSQCSPKIAPTHASASDQM